METERHTRFPGMMVTTCWPAGWSQKAEAALDLTTSPGVVMHPETLAPQTAWRTAGSSGFLT